MLWVFLMLVASPAKPATREPTCEVLDAGHYVPVSAHEYYKDPTSITGRSFEIGAIELITHGKQIAMGLERGFGMRYRLRGLPIDRDVRITWRITFPRPIRGGAGWQHDDVETTSNGELVEHMVYDFDHDYELVAGKWTFQVAVEGHTACSFVFDVE